MPNPGGIDVQALLMALKGRPGGVASGGRTNPIEAMQQRILETLAPQGGAPMDAGPMGAMAPPEEMPPEGGGPDLMDLQGFQDPRGMVGELSRGANVYPGGGPAQAGGGLQYGPPVGNQNALGGAMGAAPGADVLNSMMPPRNAILRRIQAQRGTHGLLA